MAVRIRNLSALTAFGVAAVIASGASAQKKYDPGASDTEINKTVFKFKNDYYRCRQH